MYLSHAIILQRFSLEKGPGFECAGGSPVSKIRDTFSWSGFKPCRKRFLFFCGNWRAGSSGAGEFAASSAAFSAAFTAALSAAFAEAFAAVFATKFAAAFTAVAVAFSVAQ